MGKSEILKAIKDNKPAELPLPELMSGTINEKGLLDLFEERLIKAGGAAIKIKTRGKIPEIIKEQFPGAKQIISDTDKLGTTNLHKIKGPHDLALVDLAIFNGEFAVAENGAIWVQENVTIQRASPFISTHLVLIISGSNVVTDMHEGYKKLQGNQYGHGVFIAGPSKTADIEQSLVIGAHGPKSLTVIVISEGLV